MSITRITTVLAALATALVLTSNVQAQLFKPFDFPQYHSDFQFFAPGHIDTYGGGPKHKTGWFATYDRVYMNVTRPEFSTFDGFATNFGDFTWGNRFDLGYIDDDSKGWIATIWHINGPNIEDQLLVDRIAGRHEAMGVLELVVLLEDRQIFQEFHDLGHDVVETPRKFGHRHLSKFKAVTTPAGVASGRGIGARASTAVTFFRGLAALVAAGVIFYISLLVTIVSAVTFLTSRK